MRPKAFAVIYVQSRISSERSSTIVHRNLKCVPGGILKKMRKFRLILPSTPRGEERSLWTIILSVEKATRGGRGERAKVIREWVSQREIKRVQFESERNFCHRLFVVRTKVFRSRMKDDTWRFSEMKSTTFTSFDDTIKEFAQLTPFELFCIICEKVLRAPIQLKMKEDSSRGGMNGGEWMESSKGSEDGV